MSRTVLKIEGMTCGHCVKSVTDALQRVDGVSSAEVDLSAGRAVVEHDEERADSSVLVAAVADEGYTAEETQ